MNSSSRAPPVNGIAASGTPDASIESVRLSMKVLVVLATLLAAYVLLQARSAFGW